MNCFILGGASGIGLELIQLLLKDNHKVWCLVRNFSALQNLVSDNLTVILGDLVDYDIFNYSWLKFNELDNKNFELIINSAGQYLNTNEHLNKEEVINVFFSNALTCYKIVDLILSHQNQDVKCNVLLLSSKLSSIAYSYSPEADYYRASKIALNLLGKIIHLKYDNVFVKLIHPGWVKTKIGGRHAKIPAKKSAHDIYVFFKRNQHMGKYIFWSIEGRYLDW